MAKKSNIPADAFSKSLYEFIGLLYDHYRRVGGGGLSDEEIQRARDLMAAHYEAGERAMLAVRLAHAEERGRKGRSQRKRLRRRIQHGFRASRLFSAPQSHSAPPPLRLYPVDTDPDLFASRHREHRRTGRRSPETTLEPPPREGVIPAESYSADTPVFWFMRRHRAFVNARREGRPIPCVIYRPGEHPTIEHRVLPRPPAAPRRRGRRPKFSDADLRTAINKSGRYATTRNVARQLGAGKSTVQKHRRRLAI